MHMAMIRTYWPFPLMTIVMNALSIILSPLLWWPFVPLTVWTAWKLRTVQGQYTEMFREFTAGLTDRVDRPRYLRNLRAELLRANVAINLRYRPIPLREVGSTGTSAPVTNSPSTPRRPH